MMNGIPNVPHSALCALPPTPPMIQLHGRGWLSTVGLAQAMRAEHSAILTALGKLDVPPEFWGQHVQILKDGDCRLVLMDEAAYQALTATFPETAHDHWRGLINACFRSLAAEPKAAPKRRLLGRLLNLVKGGRHGKQ